MKNILRFSALVAGILLGACSSTPPPQPEVRNAMPIGSRVAQPPASGSSLWPSNAPLIFAQSAILIDADSGQTLYQKNADTPRPVASTQKLLTALIVSRDPLEQTVVMDRSDVSVEPTKLGVRAGTMCTRRQLLTAMLVHSCNDAAMTLARTHSGSVPAFASEMNRYASAIGATNSYFVNPNGLPAMQHSTARDMARIAYHAYRNSVLRRIMVLPNYTFVYDRGVRRLSATNKLLTRSSIYNGMKTGFTYASGKCLIASASNGGRNVILVQLGSRSSFIFNDAERMIQWGLPRASYLNFAMQSASPVSNNL